MTALPKKQFISEEDYLKMEEVSPVKHEYFDGEIFQMAGASLQHITISSNITADLHSQLKKRDCRVLHTDMRVLIEETGLYTYPDVVVVCGKSQIKKFKGLETLLNPILIVEVLSPSTADYDKGAKFEHYRTIKSLKEYVLVWQETKRVACFTKQTDGNWILRDFIGDESKIFLTSIECALAMEDIYDKVDFEE